MSKQLPFFSDICLSHSVMSSLSLSHDICELCNCSEAKKKTQVKLSKLLFVIAIYTVKSGKSIGSDRRKKTST
jgi:hypothetical protein